MFAVITQKFKQRGLSIEKKLSKWFRWNANSVDTDKTAPQEAF